MLPLFGQSAEYVFKNKIDSSYNCYLKVFPNTEKINGLLIRDYSNLPDTALESPYQFPKLCAENGIMTLYTNTSTQFPELFTSDSIIKRLDEFVVEVIKIHDIPKNNIFIGGISASGTRALRYAQYCAQGKSAIEIKGVFAVDAPLDLARFYTSAKNHKKNFKAGMLWEANWMLPLFKTLFNGSPDEVFNAYLKSSVFTHTDSLGGNAHYLNNTSILLFHEPDIDWWISERGAAYYDINSYDLVAFTILLKSMGNSDIELITSSGKGFDKNGNRMPHSWTIVDETYLMERIMKRMD